MRKWALVVALIAAVVGGVFASMSTAQHLRIQREGLVEESYCVISEKINCDVVNASSYSEFLGVPIAWWGVIFYALMFGFSLFALLSRKDRRSAVAVAWFMSTGSIFYSAFLAYIALVVLDAVCIECLGMYLANTLLFIFLFIAQGVPVTGTFSFVAGYIMSVFGKGSGVGFKPEVIKYAAVVLAAYAVGWVGISGTLAKSNSPGPGMDVDDLVKYHYEQSLHAVDVSPEWSMWGNPDAKVTIVEYSEYECPFCRLAAFNVKPYLREYKDSIRYFFVNYPLDQACNPDLPRQMHPMACYAAKAGICAGRKGGFWPFHDDMFRNQRQLSERFIADLAKQRGWNAEEFAACIGSREVADEIASQIASAKAAYVSGTPALFMNGRKLKYWKNPEFLRKVVKEEIKRSKEAK